MLGTIRSAVNCIGMITPRIIGRQVRQFSDDKKSLGALDYPKTKQIIHNTLSGIVPGFRAIVANSCTNTTMLEGFKAYLEKSNPIQIPQGCLFAVIRCIDQWNGRISCLDEQNLQEILSGKTPFNKAKFDDFELMAFVKSHLEDPKNISVEQGRIVPSDKRFITKFIRHSILTDLYISAKELEIHFNTTKQPVYSMVQWGKGDYQMHALLIFGVDTSDNIHFWDVSDRLNQNESRLQTMSIEEFNFRRDIPPEYIGITRGIMSRSQIYFLDKEKK